MPRDRRREFVLSQQLNDVLEAAAAACDASISEYVRDAVIARLHREGWSRFLIPALSVQELVRLYPDKSLDEIRAMIEPLDPR